MTQLELSAAAPHAIATTAAQATENIKGEVRTLVVNGPHLPSLLAAVTVDMEVAPTMIVDSDEMAEELQAALGRLATVSSAIEAERKQRKAPLLETGAWLDAGYNPAREAVDRIIAAGKQKLIAWANHKREEDRKRREAEEAKRRAEAETKAKEEAAALAAAAAAVAKAQELRAEGSEQVADAMEQSAVAAVDTARANAAQAAHSLHVAELARPAATAVKGQRESWKAECTNKALLIQHIGQQLASGDRSLLDLVTIDPKAINALAKVQKDGMRIPGLRAYNEAGIAIKKVAVAA